MKVFLNKKGNIMKDLDDTGGYFNNCYGRSMNGLAIENSMKDFNKMLVSFIRYYKLIW